MVPPMPVDRDRCKVQVRMVGYKVLEGAAFGDPGPAVVGCESLVSALVHAGLAARRPWIDAAARYSDQPEG